MGCLIFLRIFLFIKRICLLANLNTAIAECQFLVTLEMQLITSKSAGLAVGKKPWEAEFLR